MQRDRAQKKAMLVDFRPAERLSQFHIKALQARIKNGRATLCGVVFRFRRVSRGPSSSTTMGKVRLVLKELPIFGDDSVAAAKLALA
jgi:hypothetical protein